MKARHVFCPLLTLILWTLPAFGQNRQRNSFSIAGTVRDDSDEHSLESVRVDLKQSTGILVNTTFTRGNGEFEFGGLSNGDYFIEIDAKGYDSYRESISIFNAPRTGLTVSLRRPLAVETINNSGQVSAHQLAAPHKAHDYYDKGLSLLYGKSDFRGAIGQFERAIKEYPNYYEAYAQIGGAYINLGDSSAAEPPLRKSIEMSSNQYSEAFLLLAGLCNNMNRYPEAEELARKGMALDSSSWHGYYELARALSGLKQPEEAEKNAVQARNLKPDYAQLWLVLANIHIQLRNYNALLQDLDGYLKMSPTGPEADQARKTREQVQAAMQKAQTQSPQAQPQPVQPQQ
jgi:predicted Zn-dependent protease